MSPLKDLQALAHTDLTEPIPQEQLLPALTSPPFVYIPGTFNSRDLGAVCQLSSASGSGPAAGGLRPGFAFRSGALNGLTADGKAVVAQKLGVRRVFDVRSQTEHAQGPDPDMGDSVALVWAETDEVDAVVGVDEFVEGDGEKGYEAMYLDVLKVYRPSIRAVLEHVRDRPGEAFLFHCTGA